MDDLVTSSRLVRLGAIRTGPLSPAQQATVLRLAKRLKRRASVRFSLSQLYPLHTASTLVRLYYVESTNRARSFKYKG